MNWIESRSVCGVHAKECISNFANTQVHTYVPCGGYTGCYRRSITDVRISPRGDLWGLGFCLEYCSPFTLRQGVQSCFVSFRGDTYQVPFIKAVMGWYKNLSPNQSFRLCFCQKRDRHVAKTRS